MENNQTEKSPIVVTKSFLTFGPTLHYSHTNIQRCWYLAIIAYGVTCLFWSKIATGSFFSFEIEAVATHAFWRLDQSLVTGISIFEYPWQILVLGLLMGILAIVPVLISQLMSFEYAIPLILEVIVLANMPGFAICLLISCFAAACRPLRFRSRFIAVALCALPQLAYWIYFGGARDVEPQEMGFSYVPWFVAWLDSLVIAGFVLGVGHFTRYKPSLVPIFTALTLVIAVVVFESAIGFDELDYQLYVAKNDPELINEFQHNFNFSEIVDQTLQDPYVQKYLQDFYYPTDQQARKDALKREFLRRLSNDGWPSWFRVPDSLDYMAKKDNLFRQYDLFIANRPNSRRMPIVLYFSAILNEYGPDIRYLGEKDVLRFYCDYPRERSTDTWFRLYKDFPESPESLEARWRIARQWAGKGIFQRARELLIETQAKVVERLKLLENQRKPNESFSSFFKMPAESVMTIPKLKDLQRRIELTLSLIGDENRTDKPEANDRLAQFVMLNPHSQDYRQQVSSLLNLTEPNEPVYDNLLLAQVLLIDDEQTRIQKLTEIQASYTHTDGGMQALYELALIDFTKWRQQNDSDAELKKQNMELARTAFTNFINSYPGSFYIEQVKKYLDDIPAN